MMQDSVRKATPLALALVLALSSGAAFAGDNADATFSLLSAAEVSDIGAGGTVEVSIAAAGLVGVKQFDIVLTVTPSDAFDLAATTHAAGGGFFTFPQVGNLVTPDDAQPGQIDVGGANLLAAVDGDLGFGPITLTASSSFSTETEATIEVSFISVGPSLSARDVFDADALGISISVNPPPPAIIEPTLTASSDTDVSLDFSDIGDGDAADGSAGEATFS